MTETAPETAHASNKFSALKRGNFVRATVTGNERYNGKHLFWVMADSGADARWVQTRRIDSATGVTSTYDLYRSLVTELDVISEDVPGAMVMFVAERVRYEAELLAALSKAVDAIDKAKSGLHAELEKHLKR